MSQIVTEWLKVGSHYDELREFREKMIEEIELNKISDAMINFVKWKSEYQVTIAPTKQAKDSIEFCLKKVVYDKTPEFKKLNDVLIEHFRTHIKLSDQNLKTAENIQKWKLDDKLTFQKIK